MADFDHFMAGLPSAPVVSLESLGRGLLGLLSGYDAPVPPVLVADGFRFFFSNEGLEPAHIHVEPRIDLREKWREYFGT
jgi:hypothetical protein